MLVLAAVKLSSEQAGVTLAVPCCKCWSCLSAWENAGHETDDDESERGGEQADVVDEQLVVLLLLLIVDALAPRSVI